MVSTPTSSAAATPDARDARPSPRASSSRMRANGGSTQGGTPAPHAVPGGYQTAPLSSRKAQSLDMSTVERRNPGVKENPKRIRPHGLTEAPTFTPTEEEFKDPMTYIRSIAEEGQKYGIIKIIPPESWTPDFGIDTERFHFRTRRQELNSVEGGTRANLNYLDQLAKYHKQHGTTLNRFPSVDKRPLDLYRLKKAVEIRGGFGPVCRGKKWAEIGRDLGYSGKIMSSLSTSLKNSYQRYLQPYEEWVKSAKPGVQQQIEAEFGGPITPSPGASPLKRTPPDKPLNSPGGSTFGPDSPAIRASSALAASIGTPDIKGDIDMGNTSSFGGFHLANGTSEAGTTPASHRSEAGSRRESPGADGSAGSPLKRQHSQENGSECGSTTDSVTQDSEGGERRSKRLKKEPAPMVAGSHMTLHKPSSVPRTMGERANNKQAGEKCEKCGRGDDMINLLLCDSCDCGYHIYCLDPPLKQIPERDWYCDRCLVGTGEYGFADGEIYSLRQFQEKANNFKELYFQKKLPFDPVFNKPRQVTEDDVEREFWRLVESVHETVEVEYGADIHSTTHGSGFPTVERHPTNPYSTDPWNLNILPLHPESLFRHIKSDVSGMTVPWLYVGMCFSTFCWHNEDHFTYSANYQHFGATKTWYGIPGEDADKFEAAMREAVPELFEQQPDLLFQLVTLLTPAHLQKAGVRVYALDQRAGQFVVTFPKAYHAGFNHGFNFNEAVNFAPSDWEPHGQEGVERYQRFRRAPVFSHDELLLTAAARDTTIKTAQWLAPALERVMTREMELRTGIREEITGLQQIVMADNEELTEEEYQCGVCKVYCYLSQVVCDCTTNVCCPAHYRDICDCDKSKITFRLRMDDESLEEMVNKVKTKASMPRDWATKLSQVMEETPQPQLKVLKSLLSEGDKIPYFIPELAPLRAFVEKAQEWVDEATPFVSRKQTNRRKNEKAWRKDSAKKAEMEEKEQYHRKLDNMLKLLQDAENLGFSCPEIDSLTDRAQQIRDFQVKARHALATPGALTTCNYEELVEQGKNFNVDLAETDLLEKIVKQLKWVDTAREMRQRPLTLEDVGKLIKQGTELGIPDTNDQVLYYKQQKESGEMWEAKAKELMNMEPIHFQQLEALSSQACALPVSKETLAQVDQILNKQREAHRQIVSLYEASKAMNLKDRPKYKDVKDVLDGLLELHSKPAGTIDLEKEQKRHEDWMRRGKKLFGKANAPLHILMQHMNYVMQRNEHCFALDDKPRTPVEPSSREPSPDGNGNAAFGANNGKPREVFCICRQPEAGMMIECEVCHEWYHGKCLKIARGKVKEDDKYTCPICDYRVKIPRDAARPKLEELIDWQSEIPSLPFIPDEGGVLASIIDTAQQFRQFVSSYTQNSIGLTMAECATMRFYLRKIEGAEILLAFETNFFRQELHKWSPIAPEPPPNIMSSASTRKPRPTKQQKLIAQLGLKSAEELPPQFRTKAHVFRKKSVEASDSSSSPSSSQQPAFDYPRYSATSPSPGFPPHNMMSPPSAYRPSSPVLSANPGRGQTLDPALFNAPNFGRRVREVSPSAYGGALLNPSARGDALSDAARVALRNGGDSRDAMRNRQAEVDNMFDQLTNHDDPELTDRSAGGGEQFLEDFLA